MNYQKLLTILPKKLDILTLNNLKGYAQFIHM